jgi:hypothetical protein
MKAIAEFVAEIVDRRSLPAAVMMLAHLGPALPGDVAVWDNDLQGYRLMRDPQWIILAGRVRELWGEYFLEHHEETQACLPL